MRSRLSLLCAASLTAALSIQTVHARALPDQALLNKARQQGTLRVIVTLDAEFTAEGHLPDDAAVGRQRQNIAAAQGRVIGRLGAGLGGVVARYTTIPHLALEVDADSLAELYDSEDVAGIEEDVPVPPVMSSSNQVIGSPAAWSAGYTGAGQTVAILDTGVDKYHPYFTAVQNKVVSEACYSSNQPGYSMSVCPDGSESSTAEGSGIDCTAATSGYSSAQGDCAHGTHVAGTAAGNDGGGGNAVGVAKDANIIAIQIFSLFPTYCGGGDCMLTWGSDQLAGLERVYALRDTYNIAAANMSIGGGAYSSPCDSDSRKNAMDNLASVGIATVVAAGNGGYKDRISSPACISTAVSVGATQDDDDVASFSNVAYFMDLFAPGWAITSAVPGGWTESWYGTSMATPHVTGAWAVLKEADPAASVTTVLDALKSTGTPVDDLRSGGVVTDIPRINVDLAAGALGTATAVLELESASYTVAEDSAGGSVTFAVNRSGSSAGVVSVDYATVYGSAGPSDYSARSGTLTWNDTEGGTKTFFVPITDDTDMETDETFGVALSNPTGDAVIGATASATVTITDDDATPPEAPTGVTAVDNGDGTATVSWAVSAAATAYTLQREKKHKKRDSWTELTTVGNTAGTSLVDASGAGTFHWRARAENAYGVSGWTAWTPDVTVTSGGGDGGGGGGSPCKGRGCNKN